MFQPLKICAFVSIFVVPCFGVSKELSLEERVGQLLMAHFHGEVANEEAKALIQDTKIGNIIYYNWSNGLTSPQQVQALSSGLQALAGETKAKIPLLIATDQEGGVVVRCEKGFTVFPGNKALGETGDAGLAEEAAFVMGRELQAVGINMNLAPVVDVNINPRNPVIGIRSFGDQPEIVGAFGERALQGYKKAGVIATLKHFPGHGDVSVDSHEGLPVVNKSLEELQKVELMPFAKLGAQADAIMTAHIMSPLDFKHCATLSSETLSYLRDKMGFQGVIVSDSLVMQGVLNQCQVDGSDYVLSVAEAAIRALLAGNDLLILGGKQLVGAHASLELTVADIQRIHATIVQAVRSGRITEERINQAVARVLKLKKKVVGSNVPPLSSINTEESRALAQKIATLALKSIEKKSIDALQGKVALFAPLPLRDALAQTSICKIEKVADPVLYALAPDDKEIELAKQAASVADSFIVCSYNAWKNPSQALLIGCLLDTGKPVVLLVVRDPADAELFPQASLLYKTFSPTAPSLQAVWNALGIVK